MRSFAQELVQESVPVKGTLAESYLKHHRAITVLPESLRFHSGIYSKLNKGTYPALLIPGTKAQRLRHPGFWRT